MTITGFTQIFDNTAALQATSRVQRQYPLNVMDAAFSLCAEDAFTPQHCLANDTFGAKMSPYARSLFQQYYNMFLKKRFPPECPITNPFAYLQYSLCKAMKLFAYEDSQLTILKIIYMVWLS